MLVTDPNEWCSLIVHEPVTLATWLKRIWRFGGQHPTSNVLIHSLEVSKRVKDPLLKLWALVHDAHEVLTGDCTRQFKPETLVRWQMQLDELLCRRLQLPTSVIIDIHETDEAVGDEEFRRWHQMRWSTDGTVDEFLDQWTRLRSEVAR